MITYLKVKTGVWVKVDDEANTSKVLVKATLQQELDFAQEQLNGLPRPMTNAEKLAWFEAHYDGANYEQSRSLIKSQIDALKADLEQMK